MKKLLFLFMIVALFSCEKEPDCMTCRTFMEVYSNNPNTICSCDQDAYSNWIECGSELKSVNGKTVTTIEGNCTVKMTTVCKDKWQTKNGRY